LKKIVAQQLVSHIDKHSLSPISTRIQTLLFTETALLKVTDVILRETNKGKIAVLVVLDLPAEFDTDDHDILVARLHSDFGASDVALSLFFAHIWVLAFSPICVLVVHPPVVP